MRRMMIGLIVGVSSLALLSGCEWKEADDFNTSRGGGSTVNFSGIYKAKDGSAYLFGANITHLIITQIGNTIEIRDSNHSYYRGSIGAPGIVSAPQSETGEYPAGAQMLQTQINFSGKNTMTGDDVIFAGIIHAVAVDDVQSSTRTYSQQTSVNTSDPSGTSSATSTIGSSEDVTYTITEANTQYVLEGNWAEGDSAYFISAIAPAAGGTITTTTTATTTQ